MTIWRNYSGHHFTRDYLTSQPVKASQVVDRIIKEMLRDNGKPLITSIFIIKIAILIKSYVTDLFLADDQISINNKNSCYQINIYKFWSQ